MKSIFLFLAIFLGFGTSSFAEIIPGNIGSPATIDGGRVGSDGTTGAPPSGAVGEIIVGTGAPSIATGTATDCSAGTVTLTPGTWLLVGYATLGEGGGRVYSNVNAGFETSLINPGLWQENYDYSDGSFWIGTNYPMVLPPRVVTVSVNTPYYLVVFANFTGANTNCYGRFKALRIN